MDCNIQFGLNFSSTFTILFQKSVLLKKKKIHAITKAHLSRPATLNKNQGDQPEELCLKLFLFSSEWNPKHEAPLRAG